MLSLYTLSTSQNDYIICLRACSHLINVLPCQLFGENTFFQSSLGQYYFLTLSHRRPFPVLIKAFIYVFGPIFPSLLSFQTTLMVNFPSKNDTEGQFL